MRAQLLFALLILQGSANRLAHDQVLQTAQAEAKEVRDAANQEPQRVREQAAPAASKKHADSLDDAKTKRDADFEKISDEMGHKSSSGLSSVADGASNSSGGFFPLAYGWHGAVVAVGAAKLRDIQGDGRKLGNSALASAGSDAFTIVDIQGDGRCLFRSIMHCAKQLGVIDFFEDVFDSNKPGEQAAADRLRAYVMLELRKRRGEEGVKTALLAEGLSLDEYIQQMFQPHSWGGALEIYMASYVLACPIWVWQPGEDVDANLYAGMFVKTANYGDEFGGEAKAVHIRFSSKRDHYDGLLLDHPERLANL